MVSPPSPHHSFHGHRHHRHHRSRVFKGRMILLALFLWMRAGDAAMLWFALSLPNPYVRQDLIASIAQGAVFGSILLGAVWFRQNWARYFLAGWLILTTGFVLILLPTLPDVDQPWLLLGILLGEVAHYLPVALTLLLSRDVKRVARGY